VKTVDPIISTRTVTAPSIPHEGDVRDKDRKARFNDSSPGCTICLTALVSDWTEDARLQFSEMFAEELTTCGQVHMKLGDVDALPMRTIKGTTLIGFDIDGRVYHELEEHDAFLCIGGPL